MFFCSAAPAVDEIILTAGPVTGHGWSMAQLVTRLHLDKDASSSAVIEATGLRLPGPVKNIDEVVVSCARLGIDAQGVECREGELRIRTPEGAPTFSPARIEAAYNAQEIRFKVQTLKFGDGVLNLSFDGSDGGFFLNADAKGLPLLLLLRLVDMKRAGFEVKAQKGVASGTLRWRDSKTIGELSASLVLKQFAFSDGPGLNAGENLDLKLGVNASRRLGPWRFTFDASLAAGQVYLHPVFVDAAEGPLDFNASGNLPRDLKRVAIENFSISHQGVGKVAGSAALSLNAPGARIDRVALQTKQLSLVPFHATYVKPWLVESAFSKLKVAGDVEAKIVWSREGSSEAILALREVDLEDEGARFGVLGVNGEVHWSELGSPPPTRVGFKSAQFYRIDLEGAQLLGKFSGSSFALGAPLDLPMLGGALRIEELEAAGLGGEQLAWRMRGALEPISLELLTKRLEWPPFSGSLSGEVPSIRYAGGEINVDGKLSVRAFDGRVELDELKLEQPFGVVPRVTANIAVEELSLGALTQTFSFGKIEGRLSGSIDDLVLENWRPAAFDARFATPKNDTSRHRISQRAVENLARLGGTGQVLSSTVLKFFQSFSYDRLGISCRLKNGVCQMGGVEDAERGYYLVKGGGLPPRIDVFGFNTRVDWSTLLERLKSITRANEAVIR
ncbi:MAG: hypothetical protein OER43_00490 [Gammaproteobacteria bacterium]|nr:hypothetical protein [Gammaproteobacteria bacterium]